MIKPQPGAEIDGFRLGQCMHVGSMASIFRLEGPQGGLPLVMKVPLLGAGERSANVVGFEQCRTVLGSLAQSANHPTLVAYGDVETTPYLVMEHVEGARLDDWTKRAPIAADEVARLGHALALALHDIHRQDVIHLDLKPTNILYRPGGTATLIDFGLACHRHLPDLLAAEFHTPVGNWVYMAPEQVVGERSDPRSDLYALGALLYELATGRRPFGAPTAVSQLRKRLYAMPVPPRALVPGLPAWLQEIILRCLEIDAAQRYQSAAQIAFDLANPGQVAITQRGERLARPPAIKRLAARLGARRFRPSPPPPPVNALTPRPVIVVALAPDETGEPLFDALRAAVRRRVAPDAGCRIACISVVPAAAELADDTPTGRHIKQLVTLRRWAKPLGLPEECVTYHVLESSEPVKALLDYASVNEVEELLLGACRDAAQVVAQAQCTVTVVRAPAAG